MVISWLLEDRADQLTDQYRAELRLDCRRLGHPLAGKPHDGDRWIAAAAIRLRAPLVSDDRIFRAAPRLELLTVDGEH